MKKRLISMLLALLAVMGLLPTAAFAASTPEEALGEVQIYNGGPNNDNPNYIIQVGNVFGFIISIENIL